MRNTIRTSVMLVTILVLPLLVLVAQETSALLIEGQQGQTRVIQVQGKNYVEVEGLARITGGLWYARIPYDFKLGPIRDANHPLILYMGIVV